MTEAVIGSTDVGEKPLGKTTDGVPPTEVILPNAKLADWLYELRLPEYLSNAGLKDSARLSLLEEIKRDEMLPFYRSVCKEFQWEEDSSLVQSLEEKNAAEARVLDAAVADAEENLGDVEVKDSLLAKAHYLCRIGDIDAAVTAYELAREKTVGSGSRLDIVLTLIRIGLLFGRQHLTKKYLAEGKTDCEKGGDWERRNKLKIYNAIYLAQHRKFAEAAELLLECTAIFTASELLSFEDFIFDTIVLSLYDEAWQFQGVQRLAPDCENWFIVSFVRRWDIMSLDRPAVKSKLMKSPEVSQVLEQDPALKSLLLSYIHCRYDAFLESLVEVSKHLERNLFLYKHTKYFVRAIRMKAYRQFLEPFSSVTISSMAKAFGVSENFIEADVADYIANGKLNCKIDHVDRVIVYTKTTSTDSLYMKAIKHGDMLLNKVQKLSKIIDM